MYQAFDWELFGLPPPLPPLPPFPPPVEEDDYTLRRCHELGDYVDDDDDDDLGFLGLGFEWHAGGKMGGNGEDPGGGWVRWGAASAETGREMGDGQLTGMDGDDDYVDYNCLSSGLTSPSNDSEFFFRPNSLEFSCSHAVAGSNDLASLCQRPLEEFQWNSSPGIRSNFSDNRRPDSPFFHPDSGFAPPGRVLFRGHGLERRRRFDDSSEEAEEEEESVRAIARYLASFEVRTQDSYSDSQKVNGQSPHLLLPETASTSRRPNGDRVKVAAMATMPGVSVGIFHHGYDDLGRGLESTMVKPSEVFPDSRVDRFFDHQYASLPCQGPPRVPCSGGSAVPPPSTIRRSPQGRSVLEALLRSNEPIDPNRGSGAAVGSDVTDDDGEDPVGAGCRGNRKVSSAAPQVMMLKRLLMG